MSFSVPSLNEFIRIAENGMSSAFGGEVSVLRKSVLKVLSRVFAGVTYLVVLMLQKMWKNSFITTCDVDALKTFGTDYDLPNKPESFAKGFAVVKSSSSSVTLAQGVIFTSSSGVEYEVVADTTLVGGMQGTNVSILAIESGYDGNLAEGEALEFRDEIPAGIDENVVVGKGGLVGGSKIEVSINGNVEYWSETVEEYRERLLNYRRSQPCGGCDADYKSWAERFEAVTKCIVEANYPHAGAVTCVLVHFDDVSDDVAVNSSVVQEVLDYVGSDVRRPVTADVKVVSCSERKLDFVVKIYPNNEETQASVRRSLKNALRSYCPGDTINTSSLTAEIISSANVDEVAVYKIANQSSIVLSKANAEMAVINSVTWGDYNA